MSSHFRMQRFVILCNCQGLKGLRGLAAPGKRAGSGTIWLSHRDLSETAVIPFSWFGINIGSGARGSPQKSTWTSGGGLAGRPQGQLDF